MRKQLEIVTNSMHLFLYVTLDNKSNVISMNGTEYIDWIPCSTCIVNVPELLSSSPWISRIGFFILFADMKGLIST